MILVDLYAPGGQPHGEKLFEFHRVELAVDHFIDHRTDLQPLRHEFFLASWAAALLSSHNLDISRESRRRDLVQLRRVLPENFLSIALINAGKTARQRFFRLRPSRSRQRKLAGPENILRADVIPHP